MKRWNRWTVWVSMLLAIALMTGCSNAANYVKDSYPLVDMDGKGKAAAKVYEAEGKAVPEVAKDIAAQEKPKETSKEDLEQMFLVYDNRIVNLQKSPDNPSNTLIEIDTIEYAKSHYDSSFLQGYVTASLIQSIFGNSWWNSSTRTAAPSTPSYKGYSYGSKSSTTTQTSSSTDDKKPTTTDRTGSFTSKGSTSSGSAAAGTGATSSGSAGASGSVSSGSSGSSSSSGKTGSWSTSSSSSSSSVRKNDGSTPSIKSKSTSKPSTSSRSGSFSSKGGKRR